MLLSQDQIREFHDRGFLILDSIFSQDEIRHLEAEIPKLFDQNSKEVFRENSSGAIRTVFAPERFSPLIGKIHQLDRLVMPIRQLLEEEVYLFQSKFNTKVALASGTWSWHQDFTFWQDDGMPAPKALTAAIYLSDVTEFSGQMAFVPGSHKAGRVQCSMENEDGVHDEDLKYKISPDTLREVCAEYGEIVSSKAAKGSVILFHCNILHASAQNIHYQDRNILMFTFNSISNQTQQVADPRAEYMVKKDFNPIQPISERLVPLSHH